MTRKKVDPDQRRLGESDNRKYVGLTRGGVGDRVKEVTDTLSILLFDNDKDLLQRIHFINIYQTPYIKKKLTSEQICLPLKFPPSQDY